jgi:hypothetical protein
LKYKWIHRDLNGNIFAGWDSFEVICKLVEALLPDEQLDVLASPKG